MSQPLYPAADPSMRPDDSDERQVDPLQDVKRGIAEAVASRRRLGAQAERARESVNRLDQQARRSLQSGREDRARLALQRKRLALHHLQGLDTQAAELEVEQQKLQNSEMGLSAKLEAFRTHKATVSAQHAAAEVQVRIAEAAAGLAEELAAVALAIEHAGRKTERLRARSAVIDELIAADAADAPGEEHAARSDTLARELRMLNAGQDIDAELEALRRQLGAPKAPQPGGGP